jgi:hypothetical protein
MIMASNLMATTCRVIIGLLINNLTNQNSNYGILTKKGNNLYLEQEMKRTKKQTNTEKHDHGFQFDGHHLHGHHWITHQQSYESEFQFWHL